MVQDVVIQSSSGVFKHELNCLQVVSEHVNRKGLAFSNGDEVFVIVHGVAAVHVKVAEESDRIDKFVELVIALEVDEFESLVLGVEELAGVENSLAFVLCHLIEDVCLGRVEGVHHLQLHVLVLDVVHGLEGAGGHLLRTHVGLEGVTHHEDREVVLHLQSLFTVVSRSLESQSVGSIQYSQVGVSRDVETIHFIHRSEEGFFIQSIVNRHYLHSGLLQELDVGFRHVAHFSMFNSLFLFSLSLGESTSNGFSQDSINRPARVVQRLVIVVEFVECFRRSNLLHVSPRVVVVAELVV